MCDVRGDVFVMFKEDGFGCVAGCVEVCMDIHAYHILTVPLRSVIGIG